MPQHDTQRILVVDDSPTNLFLASALLDNCELDVDTAMSASQAVAMAGEVEYALILMDLSLPGRSGLSAAREIRDLGGHNREIPIVALTGHCLPQDRDACFAAGMNDFIAKPIDLRVLGTVLRRWCGVALFPGQGSPSQALPLAGIDAGILAEIRAALMPASFSALVSCFIVEARKRVERMQAAVSHHDRHALRHEAHALRSAAALFGAVQLSREAGRLDRLEADAAEVCAIMDTVAALTTEACISLGTAIE